MEKNTWVDWMCMVRIRDDTVSNMFQARQMDNLANRTETKEKVFKCLDNKGQKMTTWNTNKAFKRKTFINPSTMPWQEFKKNTKNKSRCLPTFDGQPNFSSANLWSNLCTSWIASKNHEKNNAFVGHMLKYQKNNSKVPCLQKGLPMTFLCFQCLRCFRNTPWHYANSTVCFITKTVEPIFNVTPNKDGERVAVRQETHVPRQRSRDLLFGCFDLKCFQEWHHTMEKKTLKTSP